MQPKLASNSGPEQSSCLNLQRAGITDVSQDNWLVLLLEGSSLCFYAYGLELLITDLDPPCKLKTHPVAEAPLLALLPSLLLG